MNSKEPYRNNLIKIVEPPKKSKKKSQKKSNTGLIFLAVTSILIILTIICILFYSPASYLNLHTNKASFDEEGGYKDIFYDTDANYNNIVFHENYDWLTITEDYGSFSIYVKSNNGDRRTGIISIEAHSTMFGNSLNYISESFTVTQESGLANLSASPSSIKVGISNERKIIDINNDSNKKLSVKVSEEWIQVSVIDKNHIRIYCKSNHDDPPRRGTVYVSCGNEQISVTVKQDGWSKCRRCGGDGVTACPNLYTNPWSNSFGTYMYTWSNGRHVIRRGYTEWTPWGPMPQVSESECSSCDGDGHNECSTCDGEGKIIESY